ncbi:MAG: hypothetical protein GY947_02905 [Rhodobacteraceae bacterium]|nr:hypothetical protein [Paracoccaceae bacterium]
MDINVDKLMDALRDQRALDEDGETYRVNMSLSCFVWWMKYVDITNFKTNQ